MERTPNLVLVGFMGAGKSTVGQAVAELLDMTFVDSDVLIEADAGKPISDIFADEGETGFRRREQAILMSLSEGAGLVIATGGGAFMNDEVRRGLMETGLTVYLKAPFLTLWKRVGHLKGRPLLAGDDGKERAEALFRTREPIYEKAHVSIDTTRPFKEVVQSLLEVYREHTNDAHR